MTDLVDSLVKLFQTLSKSPPALILTVVGILGAVAAVVNLLRKQKATALFVFGAFFVLAGQGVAIMQALSHLPKSLMTQEQAFERLRQNTHVNWLIRLEPGLQITELTSLGPGPHKFTFVADYEELRGHTVEEAVHKVGGVIDPGQHVVAIIFPRNKHIFPANARGLLQVIRKVDSDVSVNQSTNYKVADLDLNIDEKDDLSVEEIQTWSWEHLRTHYDSYSAKVATLRRTKVSAFTFIGQLEKDWSDLGYARLVDATEPLMDFRLPRADGRTIEVNDFGARVFLIENQRIGDIKDVVLIDFANPRQERIPDVVDCFEPPAR